MEPSESKHDEEKIERLRRAMYSRKLSEQLKERPRRQMEEIRPVVGENWHREESEVPSSIVAPRTIGLVRKALWWFLGLAVIFFVGAVVFFVYYFTIGGGASSAAPGNIDIVMTGPSQIAGGDPTQLQITVTNRNQVPLQLADLVITYPSGTRSPTDLSTDLSSQRISLGTIEAGGRRQGTVTAIFAGSGGTATVKADLEYRISGSSAIFVATSNYQALLSSSPIALSIAGNTETVSGQPVEFTITVSSNANTTIKDVLLAANFPFGFTFVSANPAPTQGSVWEIGDIRPGEKREIVLRGTLIGESGDERVFRFDTGTRKNAEEKTITTSLSENSFRMTVSEPFLGLGIAVNKSTGSRIVVSPGGQVNVVVNWQNNLSTAIQDAVIVARLTGLTIDGATVLSPDGFFRSSDGVVLWDKTTTNGALDSLAPGGKGSVSFTFQMPSSEVLKNVSNPSLTITVNAAGKRVSETGVPENLQAAALQRIAVSSDLLVTAQGLYYANPFGSSGPLPPKANAETTYAIVFTITNTTNKIENAKLTATLPAYVRWVGIYSPASEVLSFNQNDSTVTWDIGGIEQGVGVDGVSPRQAAIAIGFTPSTSQIGQEPSLLQDIVLTGVDQAAGTAVNKKLDDVTSDLIRVSKSATSIPAAPDPGFSSTQGTVVR
ncbi:hypothetical protein A2853_03120 [Candidatus Kaiserbacteria bacterium RIFCSPHIGHO2_01_FULL_55_17]|uniref:DUF11 domain-containing protein n=1 Tax=Candidatus Kaiserbacteria bacterium RIFCSPHIGHO2_01_FULL_55_17 TaxID=1798484 RepID=A0A1F6D9A3_9BACT|nr:MAG: hypothetical protein A2853_03120 [Candidatus Kaiserbacteria bacterium RIFCSPHIGHO2_01_FULL_55_17]